VCMVYSSTQSVGLPGGCVTSRSYWCMWFQQIRLVGVIPVRDRSWAHRRGLVSVWQQLLDDVIVPCSCCSIIVEAARGEGT
jgi:hypothetical protein